MTAPEALDMFHLALAVWKESRGEPFEGQVAVARVILDRVATPKRWHDNATDVVRQPWHFSSFNPEDPQESLLPKHSPSWNSCWTACQEALAAPRGWANHFHTKFVNPDWADATRRVTTIGNHHFYLL